MNCMEFRRMLLTDPRSSEPAFIEHRSHCPECAEAAARSARFERRLAEAVNVEVPENLASRILLKQSFEPQPRPAWWRSARLLALAASLLLMVGVAALGWQSYRAQQQLADEFVALVNGAPYALSATRAVSGSEISATLEPTGLDLAGTIGDVTFAGRCIIRDKLSGHLVVKGDTAPVTVFLMTDRLVENRTRIRTAQYSGIVLPQGSGTIAIVGAPGEMLDDVEARVRAALRFRSTRDA